MEYVSWTALAAVVADLLIRIGFSIRVIMRRKSVGVSLAWLTMILLLPFVGALAYLVVGELWLGNRRAEWARTIHGPYEQWLADLNRRSCVAWSELGAECEPLSRLIGAVVGIPAMPGNRLELLSSADTVFRRLTDDIDAAQQSCHLEFYIWNLGGMADDVAEARCEPPLAASSAGSWSTPWAAAVSCSALAERMRGVAVEAALPGGLLRNLFVRFDLRLHRKIVVIDGQVAYTGSLNLVDPRYFKQEAGVGQWVDAMVRIEGPAVEGLAATFVEGGN